MGRIDKVIFGAHGGLYTDFVYPTTEVWAQLFGAKICPVSICDYDDYIPGFYYPVYGIPDCNLAKVLRLIMACNFTDEYCLLTDVDMLPLNVDYFNECASKAEPDKILFFTSELDGEDKGKYPICYTMAKGSTFKKYVNPDNIPYDELVKSWDFGPMANPSQLPFSDESLCKFLFKDAPKICLERHHQHRRLCRSNWNPDPEKLASHWYIDCHMPRPFYDNIDKLKPVFASIGIQI